MTNFVTGVVRQLGRNYADGTLWLEVHVPIEKANHLPLQIGARVPVTLQVGGMEYTAGLRSTKKIGTLGYAQMFTCPQENGSLWAVCSPTRRSVRMIECNWR